MGYVNGYLHGDRNTIRTDEGEVVCKITSVDIKKATREYNKYLKNSGYVYDLDPFKTGIPSRFFRIYFGFFDPDLWEYDDIPYYMPDIFVCTNKNVAKKMAEFLKPIEFQDDLAQIGREVEINGKNVCVNFYDW